MKKIEDTAYSREKVVGRLEELEKKNLYFK